MNYKIHDYNTRCAQDFHLPLHRTSTSKDSLFYYGPLIWNSLPEVIKQCNTKKQFKRKYKGYLNEMK